VFPLHSLRKRLISFSNKHWFCFLTLLSTVLSLLYSYPLFQGGIPSGIDTPHYYTVIVQYLEHLNQHGSLPNWFYWWYGGYPESTFDSLATLILVYISYITKVAPVLIYNLTKLLSHILLGVTSGLYAQLLIRSRISAFFTTILVISSVILLRNYGMFSRYPTIVAIPFLVLTLYFCEKQMSSNKLLSRNSILFSFSLALCISIHSMTAYIALLVLSIRIITVIIYKKYFLEILGRVILSIFLALLLSSCFLMRLIHEKQFFEALFWPSSPVESLYSIMKGYFAWILGEGPALFFGTFTLIAFTLYLLNIIRRGIREEDFFLIISIAVLSLLSWGPSERQFLWFALPMHIGFDQRRFALVSCLLLCITGGIGLARLFSDKKLGKINTGLIRLFISLLLLFAVWEALPLGVTFRPVQLSKGITELGTDLTRGSQGRIYTSGFRHFHALLIPLIYGKELVGGWFYQGALTRNYLEAVKSFGQQIPIPGVKNYVPRNSTLFSNLLWWFNCKYIILGYDWFDKPEIGYLWDTYHLRNTFFKPIYVLSKERVIGGWPASDFHTSELEEMLKEYPQYFSPQKLYGEVNMYKVNNFDQSHSFLINNPLFFIGPEENYRRLFLALNSIDAGQSLVLVKGPQKLENISMEFETIIIYGLSLNKQAYSKLKRLSKNHRVIFIQDNSAVNDLDFFNKIKPQSEIGKAEYVGWNQSVATQDIILKLYDDFFYYSIERQDGCSLMRLDGRNIILKEQNLVLSGFDLPRHAYFFNDKKELDFLAYLLTPPNSSHTVRLADFERITADEFRVKSENSGWIVVKEAFFPYWKILNKDRQIYKVGPNFMMSKIERGEELHFKFISSPLRKIALIISLGILSILIFLYHKLKTEK